WPAFHQSNVHLSPLLYDIDKDGIREIVLATYNGVVNIFTISGYMVVDKLEVPRRKVRQNWYVGLNADPVDRSHPDVHDSSIAKETASKESHPNIQDESVVKESSKEPQSQEQPDEYNYDYDDYVDESMWGDEDWTEQEHEKAEDYVSIYAHILSTPVIADIEKDGVHEMVIAAVGHVIIP
ncbi:hypothetical protein QYE76_008198, partial [Lolium multiflorum]